MKGFNLGKTLRTTGLKVRKHSPEILTGLGIAGFVGSVVLVAKAAPKAKELNEQIREEMEEDGATEKEIAIEQVKADLPIFLPTFIMCGISATCIICANRIGARRQVALASAYAISEERFKEYQQKVIEKLGEKKEQVIRDEVAKDSIKDKPVPSDIVLHNDEILCYDKVLGRYFKSTIDELTDAVTYINERVFIEMFMRLNEFYSQLGLRTVEIGDDLGWTPDCVLHLDKTWVDTEEGTKCLIISYDYVPMYDYRRY